MTNPSNKEPTVSEPLVTLTFTDVPASMARNLLWHIDSASPAPTGNPPLPSTEPVASAEPEKAKLPKTAKKPAAVVVEQEPATAVPVISLTELRQAVKATIDSVGLPAVEELMKRHKAVRLSALPPEVYAHFAAELQSMRNTVDN